MQQLFRTWIAALAVLATVTIGAYAFAGNGGIQDEEAEAKYTIKQVMAKAMKGDKLNKKVLSGQASDAEKLELLDMFISLTENEPPKGEADSWKEFSSAATMAAAKVAVGREGALAELKAATNCSKCHKAHK